jgi:excisionase family DNA binding protein
MQELKPPDGPRLALDAHADLSATATQICTVEEAAKVLKIGRNQLYDLINRKKIPGTRRLGRSIRLHMPTVIAWFARSTG